MSFSEIYSCLENFPIVAAVREGQFDDVLNSPADIVFLLEGNVLTIGEKISKAHEKNKFIFVHIDLLKGIGKDRCGIELLASLNVDGIISTKASLIKSAKEIGILTVQRYFALDSQGLNSITDMITTAKPDFIEIMPGVIEKVIYRFSKEKTPVIAGGLIETKSEVTSALGCGAIAISTGKKDLWYI